MGLDTHEMYGGSSWRRLTCWRLGLAWLALALATQAQDAAPAPYVGETVPPDIERMVERGLGYLQRLQAANGQWPNPGGQDGPAIQGLALMALVAEGEDPRHGRYADTIRRGLDAMLQQQDEQGYFGPTMYHHGFATLALAELYGMLDDERLGSALARAVNLILDAQKRNPSNAWRYRPNDTSADTTVSGGCLVALFAARNAGLEAPDEAIRQAIEYYRSAQGESGAIGYMDASGSGLGGGSSGARNAIAVLVAVLADERDSRLFNGAWSVLRSHGEQDSGNYYFYYLYYAAQAYFRADMAAWRLWNRQTADRLIATQNAQGGWDGPHGSTFCTTAALLTLALNYRYLPIYER